MSRTSSESSKGRGRRCLQPASTTWNGDFTGHLRIRGCGIDQNRATQFWGYHHRYTVPVHRDLFNGAVLCAEGWEHVNGHLESRGRACAEVHF